MSRAAPRGARLWLVRHAAPEVAPGTCYGRLDVPACPQATQEAAHALDGALPAGVALGWHSPAARCAQLARALHSLRPDMALRADPRLAEMDFGRWEGQPWAALPRAELEVWAEQLHVHAPGGGEPLQRMLARVAETLAQARIAGTAGDVLWITHAGVVRCVHWLLAHGGAPARAQDWPRQAPGYGRWTCVPLDPPPA